MTRYGVIVDEKKEFGRQLLTLWTGTFSDQYEGHAVELPRHDGFMVHLDYQDSLRVTCPAPRDETNYQEVDAAINEALNARQESPAPAPQWTPYDTGIRLEPKPWHVQPANLPDFKEADRYGRVDFDNDASETVLQVMAQRGPLGPILHIPDYSGTLTIKYGDTEITVAPK